LDEWNNRLDDTDGDGSLHISDSESTKWWEVSERLDAHWLGWLDLDDGTVGGLDEFWVLFKNFTVSSVDLLFDDIKLASDMSGMAIQNWSVTVSDLTWVTKDDDLSIESIALASSINFGVRSDVTSLELFDSKTFDIESDVVTWDSLWKLGVMHLNGFDLSNLVGWGEVDGHSWFEDTGLDSTNWDCSDTRDLVDILEWESEWLVQSSLWGLKFVESLIEGLTLVPFHVVRFLDHVVTVPSGDWDELDFLDLVTNFFKIRSDLSLDLIKSGLVVLDSWGVHLVDANDHLLDTKGESKESVLSGLSVLGVTGFELTWWRGDHEDGAIGLRGTSNHVLDEISMAWGINDGEEVLLGLELPEGDIDGDTSLTLRLKLVEDPSVFERRFTNLLGFFLVLLEGSLFDTTALVDHVTSGGRFTGIDVTDDDEVDMSLFLRFLWWHVV
jgi:hypothetical protein